LDREQSLCSTALYIWLSDWWAQSSWTWPKGNEKVETLVISMCRKQKHDNSMDEIKCGFTHRKDLKIELDLKIGGTSFIENRKN
jgi:hypothetical protein